MMGYLAWILAAVKYASSLLVSWFAFYAGYQLVWHPLRRYPGPLLAKLTDGYAGWHAIKRDLHHVTYNNHLKYGSVVRQAPNRLVFNTIQALHDIYLDPRVGKSSSYSKTRMRNLPSIFNTLDKNEHRRKRRFIGQALSEKSMREFEPTMASQVQVFLNQILQSKGENINVTPLCQCLAVDVVGRLAFGHPFKTQTEEELRFIPTAMASLSSRLNLFIQWPTSHKIDPGIQAIFHKRIERFRAALRHMIETRMALPVDAKYDLYSIFANEERIDEVKQEGIRGSEIWAEAGLFFTAGGSTTATLMAATFFYLSRNPQVYSKLAHEIRTTYTAGKDICLGPELTGCQYLRAVLDETLRMAPPTAGPMWRQQDEFESAKPFIVDGHVIPPGTAVSVGIYSIMHNSAYFKEPFRFNPERWLEAKGETDDDKEARTTMRRAFVPFALGDRSCAGKALAYAEASLTIAKAMFYFDFKPADGQAGELGLETKNGGSNLYHIDDVFTSDHDGPNLVFTPRDGHWKDLIE